MFVVLRGDFLQSRVFSFKNAQNLVTRQKSGPCFACTSGGILIAVFPKAKVKTEETSV